MRMTEETYQTAVDEHKGYCTTCDALANEDVEPDAYNYECDDCGAEAVMGVESALTEGLVSIVDEDGEVIDPDDEGGSFL